MATLVIDTNDSSIDTILSIMPATCSEPSIACDDDSGDPGLQSKITRTNFPAGTYVLAVDGFNAAAVGPFNLHVSGTIAAGGSCEGQLFAVGAITCQTGFVCDGTPGARTCRTQCSDGVDNNVDGKIDFPNDPGCDSPADNTEDTVCPGASCPVCSDGIDNDNDGTTDFPADLTCKSAAGASELCPQTEAIAVITTPATNGTTVGQTNDFNPTCASSAGSGPDVALQLDLPQMVSLNLNLTNLGSFDSVTVLLDSTCGGTAVTCSDSPTKSLTNVAAGRYFVIVDGFFATSSGTFTLNTSGVVAVGGSCESPLFTAGAFTCTPGFVCDGTPGARTCRVAQCNDGIDNNSDGLIDFPNDPGCSSPGDNTEETVCPGPACPVCANGLDDDIDGLFDWPSDFGCAAAGGTTELFCTADPDFAGLITQQTTNGTMAAPAAGNLTPSCQANSGNDVTYALQLPVPVTTLVLDTLTSTVGDTVLSLKDANCGVELGCDDDSAPGSDFRSVLTLTNVPAGNYAVNVDSFSTTNNGAFTLHVTGTVAPNTVCTSPLFAAGVLVCPSGTTCNTGTCH
jgi:hypothetical protein